MLPGRRGKATAGGPAPEDERERVSAGRAGQLLGSLSVHGGRQLPGKAGPACAERADVRQRRRSTGEL
ncbi:uncharacterized protein SCHCODRAFT_02638467 [Schizophyllum commune H4-8]|uniref:uncharacterized protein n=1 Tax=Schizophyllum commune (strain H4-8 / FGSC 9210) TaxID=578458 RepID=UPI00215F365A|nr:uncharacterized protein SCHCODRAFT_02638467 [Schizophyllum commune H4-8]KAI5887553.1 hypothetical protein SCHCODRAFT_02638467 [Schizophyllum commune H4-8]